MSAKLQSLIALSAGEAEHYAITKVASVAIALAASFADLGLQVRPLIERYSTTAASICDRLGVGHRTKHILNRYLWEQERVQAKDVRIAKIGTDRNTSVVATKPVSEKVLLRHCTAAGIVWL